MKKNLSIAITLLISLLHLSTAAQVLNTYEAIELNRGTWPYIIFKENGTSIARIQGTNGNFAITNVNGSPSYLTVNSTTGNVGIGTANPSSPLEVKAANLWNGTIRANSNSATEYSSFALLANNTLKWAMYQHPGNSNTLYFANADGQDKLAFTQDGKLGIGVVSPQAALDVSSNAVLGSVAGNYVLLNRFYSPAGTGGNVFSDNTWLYRDEAGTNWLTARLHKGISIDGSYTTPGNSTRTWWERDPFNDIQSWGNAGETYVTLAQGDVGIGTATPDAKLAVKGDIHTREVRVDMNGAVGPDYVFEKDYDLLSLTELEAYINQNKHLPEVPTANEMEANGLNLKEMNLLLLKKVEELTLHVIEQNKKIEGQHLRLTDVEAQNLKLQALLNRYIEKSK